MEHCSGHAGAAANIYIYALVDVETSGNFAMAAQDVGQRGRMFGDFRPATLRGFVAVMVKQSRRAPVQSRNY